MDEQNRNLLLAMVLSTAVLFIWFILFPPPEPVPQDETSAVSADGSVALPGGVPAADAGTDGGQTAATDTTPTSAAAVARLPIDTPSLSGSLSLAGGRIDTLLLKNYDTTIEDGAPEVQLLSPLGTAQPYYTLFGWAPGGALSADDVPGPDTTWSVASGETLSPGNDLVLTWQSPAGLTFTRTVSVDDRFMFTVTQTVENTTDTPVRLAPYGVVARHGEPQNLMGFFIIHEGAIRMTDGELTETDYDDIPDLRADEVWGPSSDVVEVQESGWIGFTDHYWMTTLIPQAGEPFTAVTQYVPGADVYRTLARHQTMDVAPGASATTTTQVFAGAKEWETIRDYEAGRRIEGFTPSLSYFFGFSEQTGIDGFIDAIDWGWFYFLTKPIFFVLHELNALIGNMGWAIIGLTLLIKAILFPLARKSYVSMARMKELQPEMEKIKERAGDDRQKLQTEMMALYKKEKVNPASGCLPILLQIPIFFSLYKVIFVTIELRHAPFFGPFQDLSSPDPTSIWNLFGLLPYGAPEPTSFLALIFIGILPILLGISMWLQQKLNPAPTDPTQAMIFAWMPWVFMFMLGGFASGLVIYWIANNTITFTQQYLIMRSHGYKPDIWGNIRAGARAKADAKPANADAAPKKTTGQKKPKK
ncbi:membrane protein insertase YidC [Alphaproteobacteria bacterium GH1-50]|uniref:Membrane protein insertase YidC n=1 Tax=Kangsaoukella pontilimi TaxID=2691042 RepID=A0A7C9IQN4_9RHOB|nr:membrane protein insertase YidC [Kangsaoukella pontilimi]MXQ06265.1 membrane protein insertase YidC [Kangsaoukella pontilimi]